MENINVDWKAIRPINGSRQQGFETLCRHLADAERPENTSFFPKGNPDAGVECYIVFQDGSEWGWQAKYFDTLGDSQWSQLDKSVKTALDKHPRLVRYYVCVPLDRPDARIEGRRSAMERWDSRVTKWSKWATSRKMNVDFFYWGNHELLQRLTSPEWISKLHFWFGIRAFDQTWFNARMDEAIRSAGPRYTPDVHVELSITSKFEAIGRTKKFFENLKALARPIRRNLSHLESISVRGASVPHIEQDFSIGSSSVDDLPSIIKAVADPCYRVLAGLGENLEPIGLLRFKQLIDEIDVALAASDTLEQSLSEMEKSVDNQRPKRNPEGTSSPYSTNPFRNGRRNLNELNRALSDFRDALVDAETFAGARLMLLTGRAGTGKTHLLCDITRTRIQEGQPTVLLMGQRFLSKDTPWTQALQHLDLAHLSTEEFVSALESAAQVAECRALLIIDALNEGTGRQIWPEHLAAFLTNLEKSQWIAIVLSVRSSYKQIVIPEEIRAIAVGIEHYGFAGHEHDATRAFFEHYNIELPSTPLLVPEFQNPLFLKSLCRGLNKSGQNRLPRGFQGISATFELFIEAVNEHLAKELDYNSRHNLVRKAVELLADTFVEKCECWLPIQEAENLINSLLPNRDFHLSLYYGLVSEGLIIEIGQSCHDDSNEEVVLIAYDRLNDHFVTKRVLDRYLNKEKPDMAFREGGAMAYLGRREEYVPSGFLEALCIQVSEITCKELPELLPDILIRPGFAEAFRQSLVWRAPNAISSATTKIFRLITRNQRDLEALFEVFITLAAVPDHPLNALYLNMRLREKRMPDRDADWSIFLHHTWGYRGAVERLIDWAWSLRTDIPIEEKSVDLCATALAWMLTTSNRFLRDRATKALVNLLTNRLPAVVRLIKRFFDVDDPYVSERVYAVAYGCAMRSHDLKDVGRLAKIVYKYVFKEGSPPVHILLRDYARGVIERAIYLGSALDIDPEMIRPPYQSIWPHIPSDEEIEHLKPDWRIGSYDSGDLDWAKNRIGSSILEDDFARYVIGTNSWHTNWLSMRLEETRWQSLDERLSAIVQGFTEQEKTAWDKYNSTEQAFQDTTFRIIFNLAKMNLDENLKGAESGVRDPDPKQQELELLRAEARANLLATLTQENSIRIEEILALTDGNSEEHYPPKFDLRLIQRYILWRVFDLGWTRERFGYFDRHDVGYRGREASKAERIGKKYQWIACHEISALVADHFQYHDGVREDLEGLHLYEGPWQESFRDIDPSCTLRKKPGGTSWEGHPPAWWGSWTYENWTVQSDDETWVQETEDLPKIEDLLIVTNPKDGTEWVVLDAFQIWKQTAPPDYEPHEVDRREVSFMLRGYMTRFHDAEKFMAWAEDVDFWGCWMPEPPRRYEIFLGEHKWSQASKYFQCSYFGGKKWVQPGQDCPAPVQVTDLEYFKESSGFDCSVDDGYTIHLPSKEIIRLLGLRWNGDSGDYVDEKGCLAAFDPAAHGEGPSALLVRKDILEFALQREGLSLCWTVLGEKRLLPGGIRKGRFQSRHMSGAYMLRGKRPFGFLKCRLDESRLGERDFTASTIVTLRTQL